MSYEVKVPPFDTPPGKIIEKVEVHAVISGVRQAVIFANPGDQIELTCEPEECTFIPIYTNLLDGVPVVEPVPEPVEPAEPLFPPTPAPEDLVIEPVVPEPAPVMDPTIPPTIDIAD